MEATKEIKIASINPLFEALIKNYAHLITVERQTKGQFVNRIQEVYSMSNQKNRLFCEAVNKSDFDSIKLSKCRTLVIFNQ